MEFFHWSELLIWVVTFCGNLGIDYVICVLQIPSRSTGVIPLNDLENFKTEVPVLGLLGTPVHIEHSSKFSISDEVQLVCKYLKAYETKRIDMLYRESKWLHHNCCCCHNHQSSLHSYAGCHLVKFSADPELPREECQRLLHKYMRDHIKENKITQKVFI